MNTQTSTVYKEVYLIIEEKKAGEYTNGFEWAYAYESKEVRDKVFAQKMDNKRKDEIFRKFDTIIRR